MDLETRARSRTGHALERVDESRQPEPELLRLVERPLRVEPRERLVDEPADDTAVEDGEGVERRIELRHRQLHLRERLARQRERGRGTNPVLETDLHQPLEHRPELEVAERADAEAGNETRQVVLEGGHVHVGRSVLAGQDHQQLAEEGGVLAPEGEEHEQDERPHAWLDLAHHPEVEEPDPVLPPAQVPRMRVGVEEAFPEDLEVVRVQELPRRLEPGLARRRLAHRHAPDLVEDEQARRRQPLVHARHAEPPVRRDDPGHPLDVRRLLAEVELPLERRGKVLDDERQVEQVPERGPVAGLLGEEPEQAQVAHDLVARGRPLHLHDDALAGLEPRGVHLRDRAGGERLRVDLREHVLPRNAELLFHDGHDLGLRERLDAILERRELLHDLRRQEVGARREHLAELREGGAELLERRPQPPRPLAGRLVGAPVLEPVLREHARDARRAAEERALDRHRRPSEVSTMTTVHGALCETRFGTLPSRNSRRPLMPTLPTTSTSAFSCAAARTIASDGSSAAISTSARAPSDSANRVSSGSTAAARSVTTWRTRSSAS